MSEKCDGAPDWTECRRKFAGIKSEIYVDKVRWILKMRADSGTGILYFAADPDFKQSWRPGEKYGTTGLQPSNE